MEKNKQTNKQKQNKIDKTHVTQTCQFCSCGLNPRSTALETVGTQTTALYINI
jgi:hypothetical protein